MDVGKLSGKEKEIYALLAEVKDPELGFSITEAELVDEVKFEGGAARITYHLTAPFCPPVFALYIGREIRKKALEVEGVEQVEVTVKDHVQAEAINKALRRT
ncbi:MAG: iron-sulfur cluster assembly protein [Candidatus Bathyarchaeia archaeon]